MKGFKMDEDKVQEPLEYQILREAIDASQRSAKAQEAMLADQVEFRKNFQPMKLRDQIAIAALSAIIGRGDMDTQMDVMPYCQDAYTIADAMLEARESLNMKDAER
jgi:hypothetical protein